MYPITNAVKALFDSEQRQVLRITGTDKNGTAISITDADVMMNGFSIDRYCCNTEKLEIGTAVSAEMTLTLDNRNGQFDNVVFEGTELFAEIGIADWSTNNPSISYIPCGYFTCYEQPRRLSSIKIHALDRMAKFDNLLAMLDPWTDGNGNIMQDGRGNIIYFNVALSFPTTVKNLISAICARCGVPFTQNVNGLPNSGMTLQAMPELDQSPSLRNYIQWCAGIMGTNAWIDWNGELRFSWYDNSTNYTSSVANRYDSDLYENPVVITGITFTDIDENNSEYLAGIDTYTLDLTGNYLLNADNAQTALGNIYNVIHDFAYTPFSASVINAPYLWPMDRMTFTDVNGTGHVSSLTNVNFGLNGSTKIAAKGQSAETNGNIQPAGFTSKQSHAIEKMNRVNSTALSAAVNHATQMITGGLGGYVVLKVNETTGQTEEILIMDTPDRNTAVNVWRFNQGGLGHSSNGYNGPFNDVALTADGQINANMITVGKLVADMIQGGTLTLGGLNNVNGLLKVLNGQNEIIGTWDNNGIDLYNGLLSITKTGPYVSSNTRNISIGGPGGFFVITSTPVHSGSTASDYINYEIGSFNNSSEFGFNVYTIKKSDYLNGINNIYDSVSLSQRGTNIKAHLSGDYSNSQYQYPYPKLDLENDTYFRQSEMVISGEGIEFTVGDTNYIHTAISGAHKTGNMTITITGNYTVTGTKSRLVTTNEYSDRLLYCYETPTPMFGDIGEGTIGEDGLCYVALDPVFSQTITTDQYQVFLQRYGDGDCYVRERRGGWFIVAGTPGLSFGWEIKAKQRDYDQLRLERNDEPFNVPVHPYGEDAINHIEELRKERETA